MGPEALRVLVVDDHSVVRRGTRRILEDAGIEVTGEAATAEQALEITGQAAPDVVLADVRLPGMSGIDLPAADGRRRPGLGRPGRTIAARHSRHPGVGQVRLRWTGHQLRAECEVIVDAGASAIAAHQVAVSAEHGLLHTLPRLSAALAHLRRQPAMIPLPR